MALIVVESNLSSKDLNVLAGALGVDIKVDPLF